MSIFSPYCGIFISDTTLFASYVDMILPHVSAPVPYTQPLLSYSIHTSVSEASATKRVLAEPVINRQAVGRYCDSAYDCHILDFLVTALASVQH